MSLEDPKSDLLELIKNAKLLYSRKLTMKGTGD